MSGLSISDSSFSVSPCWLFVGVWAAPTLSARTFTMPSGQSGRTLWNVPKPSNRFQVLRATSQPPTITTLCVIGLPTPYAISPLKERGQSYEIDANCLLQNPFLCFHSSVIIYLLVTLWLVASRHSVYVFTVPQLSTDKVPPCFQEYRPPGSSIIVLRKTGRVRWCWAIPPA